MDPLIEKWARVAERYRELRQPPPELILGTHPRDLQSLKQQLAGIRPSGRQGLDLLAAVEPDSPRLVSLAKEIVQKSVDRLIGGRTSLFAEPLPARDWLQAFWLAWALRDARSLALLMQSSDRVLSEEAYEKPFIDALQALFTQTPTAGRKLIDALELADPAKVAPERADWVLDGICPVFECLVPILDRDVPRFVAALQKLLGIRADYFAAGRKGFEHLSVEAIGLVGWARTAGIELDLRCAYTPAALLKVTDPGLVVCPDCGTPVDGDCQACRRKQDGDELLFGFSEWYWLDRDACGCGHRYPVIMKRCPLCRKVR